MQQESYGDYIDFSQYILALVRHMRAIVLIAALFGALGFCWANWVRKPLYQATALAVVVAGTDESGSISSDQLKASTALIAAYRALLASPETLPGTLSSLAIDEADVAAVEITAAEDSPVMRIAITAASPEQALALCTALTERALLLAREQPGMGAVYVRAPAALAETPVTPSPLWVALAAAAAGAVASCLAVVGAVLGRALSGRILAPKA